MRGMTSCVSTDPASRSCASWVARLAYLKSRSVPDSDPGVIEAREALAYYRVHKAVDAAVGLLSRPGVDRLVTELRGAVAQ
jgi:hypothetical protein